jgi:hypothetical protein
MSLVQGDGSQNAASAPWIVFGVHAMPEPASDANRSELTNPRRIRGLGQSRPQIMVVR